MHHTEGGVERCKIWRNGDMQRHMAELSVLSSETGQDKGLSRFGSHWKRTCATYTGRQEAIKIVLPSQGQMHLCDLDRRCSKLEYQERRLTGEWITLCPRPEFSEALMDLEMLSQTLSLLMAMSLKTRTPSAWEVLLVLLWESVICSTLILVNSIFISHYPYAVFSSGNWNKVGNGRDKHFSLSMAYILVIQMDN